MALIAFVSTNFLFPCLLEGIVLLEPGVEEEDGGGAVDLVGDAAEEGEVVEGRTEGEGGKRPQQSASGVEECRKVGRLVTGRTFRNYGGVPP